MAAPTLMKIAPSRTIVRLEERGHCGNHGV